MRPGRRGRLGPAFLASFLQFEEHRPRPVKEPVEVTPACQVNLLGDCESHRRRLRLSAAAVSHLQVASPPRALQRPSLREAQRHALSRPPQLVAQVLPARHLRRQRVSQRRGLQGDSGNVQHYRSPWLGSGGPPRNAPPAPVHSGRRPSRSDRARSVRRHAQADQEAPRAPALWVRTDRAEAVYRCGRGVTLGLTLPNQGEVVGRDPNRLGGRGAIAHQ